MKLSTLKSIRNIMGRSTSASVMPILNCFLITKEWLFYTDLLIQVTARHFFPLKEGTEGIIVRSDHFLQVMQRINSPFFINGQTGRNITFEQPESVRTLRNENVDHHQGSTDFPQIFSSAGMEHIFQVTPYELAYMDIASQFIADDDLRPIMATVCVGKDFIVSSDAHILYYRKIGISDDVEVLFDKKVIKLMMLFPNQTFQIGRNNKHVFAVSPDITICWRSDVNEHLQLGMGETMSKSKYPNWKAVLPKTEHSILLPVKEMIDALKSVKFALNPTTHQARFQLEGDKLKIIAKDVEADLFAAESINVKNPDNNTIEFAMKHDFVLRVLKCFLDEGYSQISFGYVDCNHAFVFGDQILCMPMMLN